MCRYVQAYNPAVHILRHGLSDTSVFTWLLLGGDNCRQRFLQDGVLGSGVRFECVVSGKTCCEVLSLMPTYGTRMAEFCLTEGLLVCLTKDWPYYINSLMLDTLDLLVKMVYQLHSSNFHNSVSLFLLLLDKFKLCFCCFSD